MTINGLLIPSKFILVSCHFITSLMAYYGAKENILANFQTKTYDTTSDTYTSAYNSIVSCIILGLIGLGIEMIFIITGITMFYDTSNFLIICLHAVGIIIYSEFIIGAWPYYELWYYWAAFILLPVLLEIVATCFGNILYGTAFKRRLSRKGN
ncbi:unnamed protein product [Paramecium primaurelia]|uniref:Transmembrane protein 107 n=1 Tax=Paramecium primaurelia TaxID=5886 RepID=A0A8S1KNA7_PARPR|nr:unnamed protein product [Paramecium primaurelia]